MASTPLLSRDEEWRPSTAEEKLDHLDSVQQIRQLPVRYALALDSRNMDDLVELFVHDVQVGRNLSGREELRNWMTAAMSRFDRTIHLVANHVLNFVDADHASGIVYCRDEVESDGRWRIGHLQYWDTYERRDRHWYFVRRGYNRWGVVDEVVRTSTGLEDPGLTAHELPQAWPSWDRFRSQHPNESGDRPVT